MQRLVTELTRRVEQLLLAPTPTYDRRTGERLAINTMWEQEIFRDVVETFAFGLQPPSFRHALYHAGTPNGTLSPADLNERSREFDWLHEDLSFFDGAPPTFFVGRSRFCCDGARALRDNITRFQGL